MGISSDAILTLVLPLYPCTLTRYIVQTIVSDASKNCTPSEHTNRLAVPKQRPEGPFRDPEWTVQQGARQATASERLSELAKAKKVADGYQPSRDVLWRVSIGARNAVASNR